MDRPQDEAIRRRRANWRPNTPAGAAYPWQKLGLSPLAAALEPLAQLAGLCHAAPGAPTPEAYAEFYARDGWRVDAAALATMAACGALGAARCGAGNDAGRLPAVARETRPATCNSSFATMGSRFPSAPTRSKRLQGGSSCLRTDCEWTLPGSWRRNSLAAGIESTQDWEWSTIPSVTATAKPAASPIADAVQGGEAGDEFSTRLISTGQLLTQDRFVAALKPRGWQCLGSGETGDPSGSAWTEAGALDKRGHTEGWKLARSVEAEVRDLVSRIGALLKAGWTEVIVVTDHGWLLLPGGLPKVELKVFLAEHRWGRCAAMKSDVQADVPTFKWHWNQGVAIASPPGVGCYRASVEYSHGGVSLQEMVTPVLRVMAARPAGGSARLLDAKWTGAKCRISVGGQPVGVRVDVRTSQSDPSTSLLTDKQARETTSDGKVTVFLEDDSDIGRKAEVVLLDASGQVIDSLPTTLGA